MPGFRRAQLRGSDELFRTTDDAKNPDHSAIAEAEPEVHPVPTAPAPDQRSLRLSAAELDVLIEAVQHLKFPGKLPHRPSVDDFERLEDLRQKLTDAL